MPGGSEGVLKDSCGRDLKDYRYRCPNHNPFRPCDCSRVLETTSIAQERRLTAALGSSDIL